MKEDAVKIQVHCEYHVSFFKSDIDEIYHLTKSIRYPVIFYTEDEEFNAKQAVRENRRRAKKILEIIKQHVAFSDLK